MTYLLDTDILSISARSKAQPDLRVIDWLDMNLEQCSLSVVSIWELEFGCERVLARGALRKAADIRRWIDNVVVQFGERILPVEAEASALGGRKLARAESRGVQPGIEDALIAAQAELLSLTIVTGNRRHFEALGASVFDPRAL